MNNWVVSYDSHLTSGSSIVRLRKRLREEEVEAQEAEEKEEEEEGRWKC